MLQCKVYHLQFFYYYGFEFSNVALHSHAIVTSSSKLIICMFKPCQLNFFFFDNLLHSVVVTLRKHMSLLPFHCNFNSGYKESTSLLHKSQESLHATSSINKVVLHFLPELKSNYCCLSNKTKRCTEL